MNHRLDRVQSPFQFDSLLFHNVYMGGSFHILDKLRSARVCVFGQVDHILGNSF